MKDQLKSRYLFLFLSGAGFLLFIYFIGLAASSDGGGSPGGVSGELGLWLKANSGTDTIVNGADVSSWEDQSPNGWMANNLVDGMPVFHSEGINFNPALTFGLNGRSELSISSDFPQAGPGSSGLTIFTVFKPISDTTAGNYILDVGRNTGDGYGVMASVGDYSAYNSSSNTGGNGSGDPPLAGNSQGEIPALLTHQVAFGVGRTLFGNGAVLSSTVNPTLIRLDINNVDFNAAHSTSAGPLTIGRQAKNGNLGSAGGRHFRGDIAEVIVYTADISGTNQVQVESYLAIKYGLTLASGINYLDSSGTVIYPALGSHSGFTFDIAGIGVDDGSLLVQPASSSVNPGRIITVTGDVGNFSNGEFFIWGNDNGPLSPSADVPSSAPAGERLTRVWRAAETGEAGDVSIAFDLSNVPGGIVFTYPAAFVLLVDDDGNFENAAMITGAVVNGQTVVFDGVDLNDGDYFTITYPTVPPVFYQFIPAVFR